FMAELSGRPSIRPLRIRLNGRTADAYGNSLVARGARLAVVVRQGHQRVALGIVGPDAALRDVIGYDAQASHDPLAAVVDSRLQIDVLVGHEPPGGDIFSVHEHDAARAVDPSEAVLIAVIACVE